MDYGFEAAGFETRAAVEMDADCCRTLESNRSWPVVRRRIEDVPSDELLARAGLRRGEADVLIGGPPCQPFSKSAYWSSGSTQRLKDPRARTLQSYMRCVEDLLPRVFVLENVHGISYSGKEEGFALLTRLTSEINEKTGTHYRLAWRVLNAAAYGVPQIRQRFFLVGQRDGREFKFPEPTHALPEQPVNGHLAAVTAWDAIGGMKPRPGEDLGPKGRWAELLPAIPEGENYLFHTARKAGLPLFGWRTRYWSFLLKLAKDRPSWTVQAQPGPAIGPFHWENRYLSTAELAAIQTFPIDIAFHGSRLSVQRQIGNAVPSLLAEVLGREVARQFFGKTYRRSLRLAVPARRPIPPPTRTRPVPKQFLHLVGQHLSHAERRALQEA